jgi:hypothetical protein
LMFSFNSLTSVAKSNIIGNVSLHTIPPISGLEIVAYLIPSWMNGISRLMCFMIFSHDHPRLYHLLPCSQVQSPLAISIMSSS